MIILLYCGYKFQFILIRTEGNYDKLKIKQLHKIEF